MKSFNNNRREFFKYSLTAVAGLIAFPLFSSAEEKRRGKKPSDTKAGLPLVDENSSEAKALNYKHEHKSIKDKALMVDRAGVPFTKQHCSGCSLYMGKVTEAQAGCSVFPGKAVKAEGWCSSWNKRA